MTKSYRIYGSEMSPYSVKVRSYIRYKGIPHEWIVRSADKMEEFQSYAKLPLIPLVVAPDESAMQDSTPIMEKLEAEFPEPSTVPADPTLAFLSALIEEYADEWLNKAMFHFRWTRETDQYSAAERIAQDIVPGGDANALEGVKAMVLERMPARLHFVGSNIENAHFIESSFKDVLKILEDHFRNREFLFGGRPTMADFSLWSQLYELYSDPTPHGVFKMGFPAVIEYVERGNWPEGVGELEPLGDILKTLEPLLAKEIGGRFLPWSDANARALADGKEAFSVNLDGHAFEQQPQKYHARSLGVLRQKYADAPANPELDEILARTGCLDWIKAKA